MSRELIPLYVHYLEDHFARLQAVNCVSWPTASGNGKPASWRLRTNPGTGRPERKACLVRSEKIDDPERVGFSPTSARHAPGMLSWPASPVPLLPPFPVRGIALNGINGAVMPLSRHRWSIDVVTGGQAAPAAPLVGPVADGASLVEVRRGMTAAGRRRAAVTSADGGLLGLLRLKASRVGFCSDQDVRARTLSEADSAAVDNIGID